VRPYCLSCHAVSRWAARQTVEGRAAVLFGNAKHRAKFKNIAIDIDIEWIVGRFREQKNRCLLSGVKFNFDAPYHKRGEAVTRPNPYSPSLDQIVSGNGYTRSNTRLVCAAMNSFIGSTGLEPVLQIAEGLLRKSGYKVVAPARPVAA
jgi:hypothetical protein